MIAPNGSLEMAPPVLEGRDWSGIFEERCPHPAVEELHPLVLVCLGAPLGHSVLGNESEGIVLGEKNRHRLKQTERRLGGQCDGERRGFEANPGSTRRNGTVPLVLRLILELSTAARHPANYLQC
jgi:hypothetical protein